MRSSKRAVIATIVEVREELVDELEAAGRSVIFNKKTRRVLTIDDVIAVSIVVARCHLQRGKFPRWAIGRPVDPSLDLIVVVRMDEANESIFEYLVLPPAKLPEVSLPLSEKNPANVIACCYETLTEVIGIILRHQKLSKRQARMTKSRNLGRRKR
jgi:hypothetical protein